MEIVPLGSPAFYRQAGRFRHHDAAVGLPGIGQQGDSLDIRLRQEDAAESTKCDRGIRQVINENPETVNRHLKTLFESIRYMKQNAGYCASFVAKHTNQEQPVASRICSTIIGWAL
jgi:hypothetical protein